MNQTMVDYKALCAELVEDLALWMRLSSPSGRMVKDPKETMDLIWKAREALKEI